MGVGAAQHFAYQHARQGDIRTKLRPPGDLIESINFWRPAANDTKRLVLRDMSMVVQPCLKGYSKQGDSLLKSLLKSRDFSTLLSALLSNRSLCMCCAKNGDFLTYHVETSGHECSETVKYPEWPQHDMYRITCAASGQLDVDSWNGFLDTGRWGTGLHAAVSR